MRLHAVFSVFLGIIVLISPVAAGVTVDAMNDASLYAPTAGINPLSVETKDGREALHMSFECTDKGTVWITRTFDPHEDWTGYGILNWKLWANSTGERSHIQVQLFDADNNQLMVRREMSSASYGRWLDMSWDLNRARRDVENFDLSQIKLLIFSAWQDHYGHNEGDKVDFWIAEVTRERSFERAGLGVAPAAAPLTLDGRLDEPCWQTAPVAEQFFRPIGQGLPRSDTSVRLLWDADNLYIGIQSQSELLNPVMQRLDEFAASVTERDGLVFNDDSLEIFLAPASTPEEYVQLAVNALGTRYDGRGLDKSWDGDWQAASARHDGYWTAELAIPWATLGIAPRAGGYLRANFFRNDAQHGESSGWSPVVAAHHTPDAFGDLFLLPETPAVVVRSGLMPMMTVGENLLRPTFTGRTDGAVTVRQALTRQERREVKYDTVTVAAGEQKTVEVPVNITSPGEIVFTSSLIDAETDALYYQSPPFVSTTSVVAVMEMTVTKDADVFCNGASLKTDEQGFIRAFIEQGANVIALEAREALAISLVSGETVLDGINGWKQSPQAPEGWLDKHFDDSDWQPARITDGRLDPAAGRYFRRVVAADWTRVVKLADVNHIHLLTGAGQHVPIAVASPTGRTLQGGTLVVMLPPGVEWVEWGEKKPYEHIGEFAGYETSAVTRNGEQWTRIALQWETLNTMPPAVDEDQWVWAHAPRFTVGMVIRAVTPEPAQRSMQMWIEGENGAVVELPREIPLTVHPPYQARRPENIELQLWHTFGVGNYSRDEIAALVGTWAMAGFNSYVERAYAGDVFNPLLRAQGMRIIAEWVKSSKVFALRTDDNRFVDFDTANKGSFYTPLCPSWTTAEGREDFVNAIAETMLMHDVVPDGLMWDMEFGRKAGCFCPRCLERFSEQFDIEEPLTNELVVEKYGDQWTDWLCRLWADLSAAYRDGLRQSVPDGTMYTYSGYQTEGNRVAYSIDWTLMGQACDVAMAGYGISDQVIADTRAALGDTPLLGGVSSWQPFRQDNMKLQYINLLTAGCNGIMHFDWAPMDGFDYLRVIQVATFLADHEEFFTDGELAHERVSGPPTGTGRAMRLGNRLLAIVTNSSAEARTFNLSIPGAAGDFTQYQLDTVLSQEALTSAEGAVIRVEPHDFAAFVGTVEP